MDGRAEADGGGAVPQTGIDAGILRKIMTGRETAVSTRNLMTLARYFGLSMQELIDAFSGQ